MLPVLIAIGLLLLMLLALIAILSRNIINVPADEAIVLTGRRTIQYDPETGEQRTRSHRIVSAGSTFRMPLIERVDSLPLQEMSIEIDADDLRDVQGRARSMSVLVNCRISAEDPYVERAIERFLTMDLANIQTVVQTTIESRIANAVLEADPSIPGTWLELESQLDAAIRDDLGRLGVLVDTVAIKRMPGDSSPATAVNGHHADRIE
ncbi:MAG: SPFH domain-containing protein [Thermomicrobiales bacterium]